MGIATTAVVLALASLGQFVEQPADVFHGDHPGDSFGWVLAAAGDVDADDNPLGSGGGPGCALVFSGATGALLHTFVGDEEGSRFGIAVAGLGDLDGDGLSDVAVGASSASPRADAGPRARRASGVRAVRRGRLNSSRPA